MDNVSEAVDLHGLAGADRVFTDVSSLLGITGGETNEQRLSRLRNQIGLLSESDMVVLLGVAESTLQYWRVKGVGPPYAKLGKSIWYRVSDLQQWIEDHIRIRIQGGPDDENEGD